MSVISVSFFSMSAAHSAAPTWKDNCQIHCETFLDLAMYLPALVNEKTMDANGITSSSVATVPKLGALVSDGREGSRRNNGRGLPLIGGLRGCQGAFTMYMLLHASLSMTTSGTTTNA